MYTYIHTYIHAYIHIDRLVTLITNVKENNNLCGFDCGVVLTNKTETELEANANRYIYININIYIHKHN